MSPRPTQPQDDRLSKAERCALHQSIKAEDGALYQLMGDLIHVLEDVEGEVQNLSTRLEAVEEALAANANIEERLGARMADIRGVADHIKSSVDSISKVVTDLSSRVG